MPHGSAILLTFQSLRDVLNHAHSLRQLRLSLVRVAYRSVTASALCIPLRLHPRQGLARLTQHIGKYVGSMPAQVLRRYLPLFLHPVGTVHEPHPVSLVVVANLSVGQDAHVIRQAIARLDMGDSADLVSGAGPVTGIRVYLHQAHRVAYLETAIVAAHLGSLGAGHQVSQWRRVNLQNVLIAHDQYSVGTPDGMRGGVRQLAAAEAGVALARLLLEQVHLVPRPGGACPLDDGPDSHGALAAR